MAGSDQSKKQVLYIHGGESFSEYQDYLQRLQNKPLWHMDQTDQTEKPKKWKHTLADDLGPDYGVIMPQMPNSDNAKYEEWKIWFERHFEYLRDGVILAGCSLGAMFLLKYVSEQKLPVEVQALFLLAPASYEFTDKASGEDGGDFNCDRSLVPQITERAEHIVIMHSKDDFIIPYDHSEKLKEILPKAELVSFDDKNHFLVAEFPELIEKIKTLAE